MMYIDEETQALLEANYVIPRWLFWVSPKSRETGAKMPSGSWSGIDDLDIIIDGQSRTYYAGGNFLNIGSLSQEGGMEYTNLDVKLSGIAELSRGQVMARDMTQAPAQVHLALLDPTTDQPIKTVKIFDGWVDGLNMTESAIDDSGNWTFAINLKLVSYNRLATKVLETKKSDAAQKLRDPDDKGRAYADVSGDVVVAWGTKGGEVNNYRVNRGNVNLF